MVGLLWKGTTRDDNNASPTRSEHNGSDSSSSDEDESKSATRGCGVHLEDFTLIRVIGKGCFGKIVLTQKKDTGEYFAMKVLNKQNILRRKQVEHTKAERRILGKVDPDECAFIVSLRYAFQTDTKLYLVLDHIPGGDLYLHLSQWRRFPEHLAKFYIAEIILALEYLHTTVQIAYRDLKPENIMLDAEGHVKLVDFGLSKEGITDPCQGANSLCGTPEYLAPEILNKQGHGTAVDIWGVGMVLFEFLTGLPPWYSRDRAVLFKQLRSAPLQIPEYISDEAASLLRGLLQRNPSKRVGSRQGIQEAKGHPFFDDLDWAKLKAKQIAPPINPMLHMSKRAIGSHESKLARMPVDSSAGGHPSRNNTADGLFSGFTFEAPSPLVDAVP
jgi:serine/threonine protein kinase